MATTVGKGIYRYFSNESPTFLLNAEKAKYIAAVQQSTALQSASGGGGALAGGTLNGQTVNFVYPAGITSLEEWGAVLEDAYQQLADEDSVVTDRTVARFR